MVVNLSSSRNGQQALFPRQLTPFERSTLLWLLPESKPGYKEYRRYISDWIVVGEGRRGTGDYILAERGIVPDVESPLPQVFAYGVIEADEASIAATLRELSEDQLEYEIVSVKGEAIPEKFSVRRQWSFSEWSPGKPCPACGSHVREVTLRREKGDDATLAVCSAEKKIWIHDAGDGVNHLVPVTNFHNALMLHKNIRDPKVALAAENFFRDLTTYSDTDLAAAFVQYNKLRKKIDLGRITVPASTKSTFAGKILSFFKK